LPHNGAMNPPQLLCTAVLCLLPHAALWAGEEPADAPPMQTVQVRGVRDPALMPYADLVMMRRLFADNAVPSSILPGLRVAGGKDGEPVAGLEIVLAAHGQQMPVPLTAGFALLRQLPVSDDAPAEFRSNQRRGSLRMEILLTVALPDARRFTAGELRRAIDDGNRVRATVLPWYLRLLAPRFSETAICFAAASAALTVGGAARAAVRSHGANCVTLRPAQEDDAAVIEADQTPLYIQLR
jgi:hypothetical protein